MARFLNRLNGPDPDRPLSLSKSRLQLAVGVNYDVFRRYLEFIEAKGWVHVVPASDGSHLVSLTVTGREAYEKLVKWLRELLGSTDV